MPLLAVLDADGGAGRRGADRRPGSPARGGVLRPCAREPGGRSEQIAVAGVARRRDRASAAGPKPGRQAEACRRGRYVGPNDEAVDDRAAAPTCPPGSRRAQRRARVGRLAGEIARRVDAEPLRVPVAVEDVVDDLEQQPELLAERPPGRLLRLGHPGHPEPEPDRRREQPPRLEPVELGEVGVGARDVEVLAADHPERRLGELARRAGRRVGEREPERLGEQRVAREQRDALAERDVRARPAAPLVVVVERRQIVVDERERVHELDRRGGRQRRLGLDRRRPRPSRGR